MKSTTMTLRIPFELKDQLDKLAEATQRTRSSLGCEAIQRYIDLEGRQAARPQRIGSESGSVIKKSM